MISLKAPAGATTTVVDMRQMAFDTLGSLYHYALYTCRLGLVRLKFSTLGAVCGAPRSGGGGGLFSSVDPHRLITTTNSEISW